MSKVMYDGKRLIPAPLVSISKTYQKSGNGEIVGKIYNLTLTGTIVAFMGSPNKTGVFWDMPGYPPDDTVTANERLGVIFRKQEAIRELFSDEGKHLEFQSLDGSQSVKCNPRILEISFSEDIWFDKCEYTISFEADELYGGIYAREDTFLQYISDASEEWSIDTNEGDAETLGIPKVYALSHTVSANGKRFYKDDGTGTLIKQPWEYAKQFVLSKLGFASDMVISSGINNIPLYYQGLNHVRNENIDKQGGVYSVTENWVLASGTATEDFSISTSDSLDATYKTVSIEGTVTGYDQRDANLQIITPKWSNAEAKFTNVQNIAFIRAQQFSGLSLNLTPTNITIGRNPIQGTIAYTYEYNTRPMTLVSGVKSESINVGDNIGGELFASVFVLGRVPGPVLQPLGTKPANTRSLSIELVLNPITYTDNSYATIQSLINAKPSINPTYSAAIANIIAAANPLNYGFTQVYQDQPQENWSITEWRYSYSTNWTYE